MPYNSIVSRSNAEALIPEEVSQSIIAGTIEESAVLSLFRSVDMGTKKTKLPVLSALPIGYFTGGDTGLKQTTNVSWENKYLEAETIAVIIPIAEDVYEDIDDALNFEENVEPLVRQAFGRVIDAAILFGTNKPASWGAAIVPQAITAGNTGVIGTYTQAEGGIVADISDVFDTVEADGYDVNGIMSSLSIKSLLRKARDANGNRLTDASVSEYDGIPIKYPMRGGWPTAASTARLVAGDTNAGIVGLRQDLTMKVLDQAIIQDNTGATIYNLAQQDMIALRFTMRVAWQVANPINYSQATEANRWPFGVLLAAA